MLVKEMAAVFKYYKFGVRILRHPFNERAQIFDRAKLVPVAMHKKYRLSQPGQKFIINVFINRSADADKPDDARVVNANGQTGSRTKRKPRQRHILAGKIRADVIEHIANIFNTALDLVMLTRRCPDAAKIESECCQTGINQTRRCPKNYLVMHRPAPKWMRMTHEPNPAPVTRRFLDDRLKLAVRRRYE